MLWSPSVQQIVVPNVLRDTLSAEANLKQPKLLCEVKDF
jgi:hypothetical protein